jgi:sirohydrochlorin cobaltochelatase
MAAWLVRAIVAENVIARHEGEILFVPAGPQFRIEKEIKNVVVSVAKSCHYLLDHVEPEERPRGFTDDLIEPPLPEAIAAAPDQYQAAAEELRDKLSNQTSLTTTESKSPGWIGLRCTSEEMAIWLQRAIVVENILARREADSLFVPVSIDNIHGEAGDRVSTAVSQAVRLWQFRTSGGS